MLVPGTLPKTLYRPRVVLGVAHESSVLSMSPGSKCSRRVRYGGHGAMLGSNRELAESKIGGLEVLLECQVRCYPPSGYLLCPFCLEECGCRGESRRK